MGILSSYPDDTATTDNDKFLTVDSGGSTKLTPGSTLKSYALKTPSIYDSNGNETVKTPATSSAVNEVTVTNAITGTAPSIAASGDDTNVHLVGKGKGTGRFLAQIPIIYSVPTGAVNNVESAKASVVIPNYPVPVTVEFMSQINFDINTSPPDYDAFVAIRKDSATGTLIGYQLFHKGTPTGDGGWASSACYALYNLAANAGATTFVTTAYFNLAITKSIDGTANWFVAKVYAQ